ncbi:MAG: tape measure protein [Polyangiaceae bacterium]|nr:tape measure protein [Polyangiaceae bacterium]
MVKFELELDADDAVDAVHELTGGLDDMLESLGMGGKELDAFVRDFRKLQQPAKDLQAMSGKKSGDAFGFAGGIAGGVMLADVIKNVASAAFNAAKQLVVLGLKAAAAFTGAVAGAAMFREKTVLALGVLRGGGISGGTKEFAKIKDIAIELGVPLDDAAKQFQKLAAMQFSPKEAERFFRRMQDLRAIGADAQQVEGAMTALTQIKSMGTLRGGELMQLANAGVSLELVYKELEKQTGKTREEVMAMQQAGKITAEMGLDAIEKAIGKKAGGKGAGQAAAEFMDTTLSGMIQRVQNFKSILLDDIAEKLGPELKAVKPMLDDIMKALRSDEAKAVIGEIAGGFRLLLGTVQKAWPLVKAFAAGFASEFKTIWGAFSKFSDGLSKAFGGDNKQGFDDLITAVTMFARVLAHAVGFLLFLGMVAGMVASGVAKVWSTLLSLAMRFYELAGNFRAAAGSLGKAIVDGIVGGITGGVGRVVAAVRGLGTAAIGSGEKTLGIASPSKEFDWIGDMTAEGFVGSIDASIPAANDVMAEMVAPPAPPAPASVSAGPSQSNTIHINIHVSGTDATPEGIAEAMRREWESLEERRAIERGAA